MGRTEDGGAIYLFGGDDPYTPIDSTIHHNRIEGTADPFSWGIYMDDLINGAPYHRQLGRGRRRRQHHDPRRRPQ